MADLLIILSLSVSDNKTIMWQPTFQNEVAQVRV